MIEFLSLVAHILVSPFKTRARLEAEIVLLRHQVTVLRRRLPPKPKLTVADRLLFVWLYRLFPSVLTAASICQAGDDHPVASDRLPPVLALEVALSWRSAKGSSGDPPPDPRDESGQPALGRTAHPRRAVEARYRSRSVDRCQVYG
jgi:hypothetical protein